MKLLPILPLAAALLLAGCAGFIADPVQRDLFVREHRYNAALRTLGPDSTRADLERLFPCVRPRSEDLAIMSVTGAFTDLMPEKHPIDADFVVLVSYEYAHLRFIKPDLPGHAVLRHLEASADPTADAIDELLLGGSGRWFGRVHPSAADRISSLPLQAERRDPARPAHAP